MSGGNDCLSIFKLGESYLPIKSLKIPLSHTYHQITESVSLNRTWNRNPLIFLSIIQKTKRKKRIFLLNLWIEQNLSNSFQDMQILGYWRIWSLNEPKITLHLVNLLYSFCLYRYFWFNKSRWNGKENKNVEEKETRNEWTSIPSDSSESNWMSLV